MEASAMVIWGGFILFGVNRSELVERLIEVF